MKLQAGRYFAGVTIPFLVPNSMVVSKLESNGARNVQIFSRDEIPKLSFDPKVVDKGYSDDWSELIVFDYSGPDKTVDVEKMWAWLVRVPATSPAVKTPVTTSSAKKSNASLWLFLGGTSLVIFGLTRKP